jgi:hypothetical protein
MREYRGGSIGPKNYWPAPGSGDIYVGTIKSQRASAPGALLIARTEEV